MKPNKKNQKKHTKNCTESSINDTVKLPKTNNKLTEIQIDKKPKIHIPLEVSNKIIYLNSIMGNIEWSGILFFDIEDTFAQGLNIKVKDILLLDIGNSAYTNYEFTSEIPSYMCEHQLTQCFIGHIHSHHTMSTFFSGTDLNTLEKEGLDTVHFVSVIVNNDGKYNGAITTKSKIKTKISQEKNINYYTYDGEMAATPELEVIETEFTEIAYIYCDIIVDNPVWKTLLETSNEILKEKEKFKQQYIRNNYSFLPSFIDNDTIYGQNNDMILGELHSDTISIVKYFQDNIVSIDSININLDLLSSHALEFLNKAFSLIVATKYVNSITLVSLNSTIFNRYRISSIPNTLEFYDPIVLFLKNSNNDVTKELKEHVKKYLKVIDLEKDDIRHLILFNYDFEDIILLFLLFNYAKCCDKYTPRNIDKTYLDLFIKKYRL